MPSKRISLLILLLWVAVSSDLFRRDVLPEWVLGSPPDYRSVIGGAGEGPTSWVILVSDPQDPGVTRPAGAATTQTHRRRDGSARLSGSAWFDSARLLRGSPFESLGDARIEILSWCEIDSSGNLDSFRVSVREGLHAKSILLVIDGHLKNDAVDVVARSPISMLAWSRSFPYRSRSMVQTTLAPLDRIPNLQVGQRWESRVVSPLTGRLETGIVEVAARRHITWNHNPVATFELVTRMGPLKTRSWVRSDGLVLRQEIPFPFAKLLLERRPPDADGARSSAR